LLKQLNCPKPLMFVRQRYYRNKKKPLLSGFLLVLV